MANKSGQAEAMGLEEILRKLVNLFPEIRQIISVPNGRPVDNTVRDVYCFRHRRDPCGCDIPKAPPLTIMNGGASTQEISSANLQIVPRKEEN